MDLLKEWLGSTVERELKAALDWTQCTPRVRGNDKYDDDGTSLRIKPSKSHSSFAVQFVEFLNYEDPIVVRVSDSVTHLNANIATSAALKFNAANRRRVTEKTVGGIFRILSFQIVATYLGCKDSPITLLINDLQSLGSDGSSLFRYPGHIWLSENIRSLHQRVGALRAEQSIRNQEQAIQENSGRDPLPESQDDQFELSSDDGRNTSQKDLATQAPRPRLINADVNSPSIQQDRKTISPRRQQPKHSADLENGHPTLEKKGKGASRISPSSYPPAKLINPTGDEGNLKKSHALLQLLDKERTALTLARSVPSTKSISPTHLTVPESEELKVNENKVEPIETTGQSDDPSIAVPNSATTVDGEKRSTSEEPGLSALAKESRVSVITTGCADLVMSEIPRRITRRDVKISKDQRDLLDASYSWLPAEPGRRNPVANLPIKTLGAINYSADSWASRLLNPPERVLNTIESSQSTQSPLKSDSGSKSESESDPELLVSSNEWPPSSPLDRRRQEQLPPDSPEMPPYVVKPAETKAEGRLSSPSPSRKNSAGAFRELESTSRSSPSLPFLCQLSTNPIRGLKSFPKPTLPVSNDHSLSSLAHSGHVTETDFSQNSAEQQTFIKSGIVPRDPKTHEDTLQNNLTSKFDVPSNQQANSIHSQRPNTAQPSTDGHLVFMVDIESSGLELNSQGSNADVQNGEQNSRLDYVPMQWVPSTAPQKEEPSLQVRRTPYVNGKVSDLNSQSLNPFVSPSKRKPLTLENAIYDRNTEQAASRATVTDAFGVESQSTKPSEDLAMCSDGGEVGHRQVSVNRDDLDENLIARQIHHETHPQSQGDVNRSHIVDETRLVIEETILPETTELRSDLVTPEDTHSIMRDRDGKDAKRKVSYAQLLSPNGTKRRRILKLSGSLDIGQSDREAERPSITSRLNRGSFVAFKREKNSILPLDEADTMRQSRESSGSSSCGQAKKEGKELLPQIRPEELIMELSSSPPSSKAWREREHVPDFQKLHEGSADKPVDEVMIDAGVPDPKKVQPPKKGHRKSVSSLQPSASLNLFDRFRLSYPDYSGETAHFTAICGKLRKLVDAGRGLHPALWDDFIIRHKIEYSNYLHDCTNRAEDPMPYDRYYQDEIDGARYINQVVTRKTIHEALASKSTSQQRNENNTENAHIPARPEPRKSSKVCRHASRHPSPQITELFEKPPLKNSRRSLPWTASDTPSSTAPPKVVTPSTPLRQSKFLLSTARSNQHPHLSKVKPGTSRDSADKASTANIPCGNRGEALALGLQPRHAVKDHPILKEGHHSAQADSTELGSDVLDDSQKYNDGPFQKFAKAYLAIESGKGNSFAKPKDGTDSSESESCSKPRLRSLDTSTWHL